MTTASRTIGGLAAHAVCAAAGVRDGLRAAQFYARDLSNADGWAKGEPRRAPFLSRLVAGMARLTDRVMTRGANVSIAILLPSWRNLPSPFTPGLMHEVPPASVRTAWFTIRCSMPISSAPRSISLSATRRHPT